MKKVYLIERQAVIGYDEASGFVVVARTPAEARALAAAKAGDEGPDCWLAADRSTCRSLGTARPREKCGVVLRDYNSAG